MTFGIYGNTSKDKLSQVVHQLCLKLRKEKIAFIVDTKLSKIITSKYKFKFSGNQQSDTKSLVSKCDFIISIGGDGTFLTTAKLVGSKGVPVIGVNYGKLGFLAEIQTDEIVRFIKDIINERYILEEKTVLQARVHGLKKTIYGMNEIVINQSGIVKTIQIIAQYNKQLVNSYHADGLIVATPTGSTAYSLSAGGPIVHPDTRVLILSPLSPHTLTARSVVLPDDGTIEVKVVSRIPFNVIADGNTYIRRIKNSVVEIKKAPYKIKLAKSLSSNYFKVLTQKLLWGEDRRKQ
jgi:NAD+ kinase